MAVDPLAAVALTVLGVLVSAYLTYRVSNRKLHSDSGMQMIDQLQEDVAELRRETASLRRVQRIQGDYIGELRRHIVDGRPAPPPPYPQGLIT